MHVVPAVGPRDTSRTYSGTTGTIGTTGPRNDALPRHLALFSGTKSADERQLAPRTCRTRRTRRTRPVSSSAWRFDAQSIPGPQAQLDLAGKLVFDPVTNEHVSTGLSGSAALRSVRA